jgi:ferritin-like metal-binding protein YciE
MNDLFLHTLKDIYYAEKQILRSMPKMMKEATTQEFKQALEKHREETEGQIDRLELVFELCDMAPRGVRCEAIDGIIAEAKDVMDEVEDDLVRDAGMLAAAQTVEHYEIARYGTLIAWAQQMGMKDAQKLLQQNLEEEKRTDQLLTKIAEQSLNKQAQQQAAK